MVDEKQAASWNPDDASGLFDNARAVIKGVKVDYFTTQKGDKFVNLDVTFNAGAGDIVEHYLLGGADQWTPNSTKTGVIPTTEGGRIWNKSAAYRFVKSLTDAGFPKNRLGNDLAVIVGSDVHVNRVTEEGTYQDKNGKERQRTILLVTKLYAASGEKSSKTAPAVTTAVPKTASTATPAAAVVADDDYTMTVLIDALQKGPVTIDKLAPAAFMRATRDKVGKDARNALTARITDQAFLAGLAEQGLIAVDGNSVQLAA